MKVTAPAMTASKERLKYLAPLTILTFLLLAFLIGAISPLVGVTGSAIIAAFLAVGLIALAFIGREEIAAWSLSAILLIPLFLSVVSKLSGVSLVGTWQIVPLAMGIFGITRFARALRGEAFLRLFLLAFSIFLIWVIASSIIGRTKLIAGVYQFLSNLKPFLLVLLGFAIAWDSRVERVLRQTTHWLWLPLALLVAFEWLAPSAYFQIFPGDGGSRASIDPAGLLPSRAVGIFEHPSILATTAAWFCILSTVYRLSSEVNRKSFYSWLILAYLALIFSTVQRQELAACIFALMLMGMIASRSSLFGKGAISLLVFGIAVGGFWLLFSQNLGEEIRLWGVGTSQAIEHPRAQIMVGAWKLASQYFPFGSGLGTFGGAGAAKFDDSIYLDLGFGGYWWFGREDYLMDTYWPNSIAEGGYIAAVMLLLAYCFLLLAAIRITRSSQVKSTASIYGLAAVGGVSYMLALSLTSPAFQDPRLFLLPAMFLGIAYGARSATSACR
jgi:hypothetical protein